MEKFKNTPFVKKLGFNRVILIGVLILMYLFFAAMSPTFVSWSRILGALNYAYFLGFLALGVTFVIATGGIDFSIGPVMFCAALISGQLLTKSGFPLGLCIVISILVGMAFGIFNGWLVAYQGLPSFITSMASMMIAEGVGSVFTKVQSVSWPQSGTADSWYRSLVKAGNIPTGIIILLIIAAVCSIVLNQTKIGRYILCLGSNKEAVRLSGIDVRRWEMLAYIICSTLAGLAAIFYVASYSTVLPGKGDEFNNLAIASCVMGGTSMAGGLASIVGTVIGTLIIAMMQEGLMAMGLKTDVQYVLTGLIVLIAVYADIRSRRRRN